MRSKLKHSIAAVLCSAFLSACMVGPKYHRPVVQTPNTFRDLADNAQIKAQSASYADLPWWQVFKDPKLLERRPDIREAEQILVAANAEIGIAKAQFFPQVTLTGSGGGSFGRTSAYPGIFPTQLGIWSYGAQVAQPVFTGGALRGNLHLAESEHSQALIAYQQTIQRAFGDVSDALIGYDKFHQVRLRQQDTVADLQQTVRISTLRYQGGTTTYLEALDSQRSLYAAELSLASARGDEYRSLVQLYRTLGGGWQQ
jgi:multidrug efflux system outer membrane protein